MRKLAVLALALAVVAPVFAGSSELPEGQDEVVIAVSGMTCAGCASSVNRAVKKLDGIIEVEVDHEGGKVTVVRVTEKVTIDQLVEAINKTGFKAQNPEKKG